VRPLEAKPHRSTCNLGLKSRLEPERHRPDLLKPHSRPQSTSREPSSSTESTPSRPSAFSKPARRSAPRTPRSASIKRPFASTRGRPTPVTRDCQQWGASVTRARGHARESSTAATKPHHRRSSRPFVICGLHRRADESVISAIHRANAGPPLRSEGGTAGLG
jgi:hypothetical protein